jgi:hypothetical protein
MSELSRLHGTLSNLDFLPHYRAGAAIISDLASEKISGWPDILEFYKEVGNTSEAFRVFGQSSQYDSPFFVVGQVAQEFNNPLPGNLGHDNNVDIATWVNIIVILYEACLGEELWSRIRALAFTEGETFSIKGTHSPCHGCGAIDGGLDEAWVAPSHGQQSAPSYWSVETH